MTEFLRLFLRNSRQDYRVNLYDIEHSWLRIIVAFKFFGLCPDCMGPTQHNSQRIRQAQYNVNHELAYWTYENWSCISRRCDVVVHRATGSQYGYHVVRADRSTQRTVVHHDFMR